jgi:hypothetical protein
MPRSNLETATRTLAAAASQNAPGSVLLLAMRNVVDALQDHHSDFQYLVALLDALATILDLCGIYLFISESLADANVSPDHLTDIEERLWETNRTTTPPTPEGSTTSLLVALVDPMAEDVTLPNGQLRSDLEASLAQYTPEQSGSKHSKSASHPDHTPER